MLVHRRHAVTHRLDPLIATLRDRIFDPADPPTCMERLELGRMFEERLDATRADITARPGATPQ